MPIFYLYGNKFSSSEFTLLFEMFLLCRCEELTPVTFWASLQSLPIFECGLLPHVTVVIVVNDQTKSDESYVRPQCNRTVTTKREYSAARSNLYLWSTCAGSKIITAPSRNSHSGCWVQLRYFCILWCIREMPLMREAKFVVLGGNFFFYLRLTLRLWLYASRLCHVTYGRLRSQYRQKILNPPWFEERKHLSW